MKSPRLSVIIPVYKVEECLDQCVESVLTQSFSDLEVILVDDGSPDACPAICDAYAARDSRVRVIHQKNLGLAGARNTGLRHARGEYVAFLDSDDYVLPEAYAKLHAKAVEHDADIVFCQAQYFDDARQQDVVADDSSCLPLFRDEKFSGVFDWRDVGAARIFSYDSFVVAWNKLCKKNFLAEIGADFPLGLIYEDNPFYFQTVFAAKRMAAVRERLVCYRINRQGSIIYDVAEEKGVTAVHVLGVLAHIEMRLATLLPVQLRPFFHAYAFSEIRYKFSLIPEHLREKYFALAKGLLPPALYWKFRAYVFAKNLKSGRRSLGALIRIVRKPQARIIQLFRNIPLFSVTKADKLPGQYAAIVAFGDSVAVARGLQALYPVNKFSLHRHVNAPLLNDQVAALIAKAPHERLIHRIMINTPCGITAEQEPACEETEEISASSVAQIASIRGSLAIASSVLLIDFAQESLAPHRLKTLFYTLNCVYPNSDIHYLRLEAEDKVPAVGFQAKGFVCRALPSAEPADMEAVLRQKLKGLEAETFHRYLRVAVLDLPVLVVRRR